MRSSTRCSPHRTFPRRESAGRRTEAERASLAPVTPGGFMDCTRREFGKLALASVPAVAFRDAGFLAAGLVQARPNSLISGVQIGTITYSYRQMPDQSAEATLKYIVDSGISAIELM